MRAAAHAGAALVVAVVEVWFEQFCVYRTLHSDDCDGGDGDADDDCDGDCNGGKKKIEPVAMYLNDTYFHT